MVVKVELKYVENFREFLCNKFDYQRVISDCISRCKRIQNHKGNLADRHFRDKGKQLLNKLYYSIEDANQGKQPNHSIKIQGQRDLYLSIKAQSLWKVQ
jgi:hypothetical protein